MVRSFQKSQHLNANKSFQRISYHWGLSKVIGVNVRHRLFEVGCDKSAVQVGGQTLYDEFTFPDGWRDPYKPKIKSSSDTIDAGGSITLWVDSGGHGIPPYNWSVSETGYSISPSITNNYAETVTLTCASGT
ncbi:MAG: hypothetical protein JRJ86_19290 [Deltaproteobacteria bacterium]|nr:hypothetical protein [Deltaproteobacteria bacterium]MBW2119600.1 hypothetical protein [Deltaproteobacteria bacterium]MBW2345479.1 hypothetical protein [Deltaproteobacteria bacterium]